MTGVFPIPVIDLKFVFTITLSDGSFKISVESIVGFINPPVNNTTLQRQTNHEPSPESSFK